MAKERGALFHTDAVQAAGCLKIDLESVPVDYMSASAHKFGGPVGVGFLYIRRGSPRCPLIRGGAQESNLRAGTQDVAGAVGMAAALEAASKEEDRLSALRADGGKILAMTTCTNGSDEDARTVVLARMEELP